MHNRLRVCLICCDVVASYQLFLASKRSRQIRSSWSSHKCTNTWLVKTRKHRSSKIFSYKRRVTAIFNGKQQPNATLIRACKSKCICLCLHLLTTLQPSLFAPDRLRETSQKNISFSREFIKACLKFTPHLLETWLPFSTGLHIPRLIRAGKLSLIVFLRRCPCI